MQLTHADFINIEKELNRRELRSSLLDFTRHFFKIVKGYDFIVNWHHVKMAEKIEKAFRGETSVLIINVPPRYTKTEITSIFGPAWVYANNKNANFIHVSYSEKLVTKNSKAVKKIINCDEYQSLFGLQFDPKSNAATDWTIDNGGTFYAAPSEGQITGLGAGISEGGQFQGAIIIDDPMKISDARSPTMKEFINETLIEETLINRKNHATTPIILVMQRLAEDDATEHLKNVMEDRGEKVEHLVIPVLDSDDRALWPDGPQGHTEEVLFAMRQSRPSYFAKQYMQSPTPDEGDMFKIDNIKVVDAPPPGDGVRSWDLAGTEQTKKNRDPDYTAGVRMIRHAGKFYIVDAGRFRKEPSETRKAIKATAEIDGYNVRVTVPQDVGQAGKDQAQSYVSMLAGYRVKSIRPTGAKEVRAEPFAAQVNAGNVFVVRGDWNRELIRELQYFPNGAHDDFVDACSDAFSELTLHDKAPDDFVMPFASMVDDMY